MAVRRSGQMSFSDALRFKRAGVNKRLEKLDAMIDWSVIESVLAPLEPPRRGAPGYPALLLFKAVLLAQWNGLSDEAMEEMLADRYSFQRFCRLDASEPSPDHSTLWRFREALASSGLGDQVFAEVMRQLDGHGFILRKGTLIDATLIEAQAAPPAPPPPSEPVEPGARPPSRLVRSAADPDAGWTRRGNRRVFGYKAHVGVDQGSGLIRAQIYTSAEVNETVVGDSLIIGDEAAVYADQAYDAEARRHRLAARNIKYRIQKRPNKHHALSHRQGRRNMLIGRVRSRVETVFAHLKRICGAGRARYFNKARNATSFTLLCIAYNLNKAVLRT